jgi:hypothetical protein
VRRHSVLFWIAVAILTTLLRAPSLFVEVLDPDEAGHAVNTWVWMSGGTPYVDFVDNKQPLLYAAYAAAFASLGRSLIAVHALTIPWLLLTAWLIGRLARRVWDDDAAARAAALLFTLASVAYVEKDMLSTNTEVLMNLPLVAAFWLLVDVCDESGWRAGFSGALAAIAALFNLKAAFALPALIAAAFAVPATGRRWRGTVWLLSGFLIVVAAATAWFWQRGALGPFLYWNVLLNIDYMGAGVGPGYAGYANGIVYGYPRLVVFALGTAPLWVCAAAAWRSSGRHAVARALRWPLVLWAAGSLAAVCLGGRFYGHYFIQIIPPLAVLASGPVSSLRDRRPILHGVAVAAMVLPACGWTVAGYARIAGERLDSLRPPIAAVADAVRAHTGPDDRIFVWGYWPQLYYHTRRRPASRFVFPQSLAGYVPGNPAALAPGWDPNPFIVEEHWRLFSAEMARHPADLIVDTAPGSIHFWERYPIDRYPVLRDLVARRYTRVAVIDGVILYRLRGEARE